MHSSDAMTSFILRPKEVLCYREMILPRCCTARSMLPVRSQTRLCGVSFAQSGSIAQCLTALYLSIIHRVNLQ